jgi:hypothetical protein
MGVDRLFEEFAERYRREGSADPREYFDQLDDPADRAELGVRIDAFLERAPRRRWDAARFAGSVAEKAVHAATEGPGAADSEVADGWPEVLPALRTKARLKRRTVVERLAGALGFPDDEERVAAYYHGMEQGQLRPAGVADAVLEALAGILGSSAEQLRSAGEAGEWTGPAGGEVFARLGAPADSAGPGEGPSLTLEAADSASPPDQLDLLFTGGGLDAT